MIHVERIGRFEVQERLRANSFAIVYRGRDPFDGRRVQIRFCVATDFSMRRRFLVAAERAALLRHPNIATVFEFGSGDGKPYLIQEAFSEESLGDLLARGEPTEDVLKLYYLVQIAKGMQYAHGQEVLHRELRPASILVAGNGDLKIADFGTARLASAFAQLGNGAHRWPAVGWLLPELLLGLELDARSDIYSFGALAFELLTGRPPFVAETLAELVPQILEADPRPLGVNWPECPPELDRLVRRCLARDPGQRFGSMDEVVEDLGMIVPVTSPVDAFEEEKTMVIQDINTVYVAASGSDALAPTGESRVEEETEEPKTATRPSLVRPSVDGWSAARGLWQTVSRRRRAVTGELRRVAGDMGSWPRSIPAGARAVGLIGAALLMFGVVGWSLVRGSERTEEPVAAELPTRPILPLELPKGELLIDTQPWAEVMRIVDSEGASVDIGDHRFTPLLVTLPAGAYLVEVARPDREQVATCDVMVSAATVARCEPELAVIATVDFFKQTGWWR